MSPMWQAIVEAVTLLAGVGIGWLVASRTAARAIRRALDEGYDEGWDDCALRQHDLDVAAGRDSGPRGGGWSDAGSTPVPLPEPAATQDVPRPVGPPPGAGPGHTYPRLQIAVLWADLAESLERAAVVEQWLAAA